MQRQLCFFFFFEVFFCTAAALPNFQTPPLALISAHVGVQRKCSFNPCHHIANCVLTPSNLHSYGMHHMQHSSAVQMQNAEDFQRRSSTICREQWCSGVGGTSALSIWANPFPVTKLAYKSFLMITAFYRLETILWAGNHRSAASS